MNIKTCFRASVIMLAASLAVGSPAIGQQTQRLPDKIELPDNVVEGFGSARAENEYKLFVPDNQVEKVWSYLQQNYSNGITLPDAAGTRFKTTFSTEFFKDVYFDTPQQTLLKMQGGIRHRSREIPGQPQNRKDGRELVQIKLNIPGEELARTEIKFEVKRYDAVQSDEDRHPLIGIVKRNDRPQLLDYVRKIGIEPLSLREALTLHQRRRRVYLSDDVGPYATLTLDETRSKKLWLTSKFTEIELELNEIRYTAANDSMRAYMQRVTDAVEAEVIRAFPDIKQDQTPKYNKTYDRLVASGPGGKLVMRASVMNPAQILTFAAFAVLVLAGMIALMIRKRRERRLAEAAHAEAAAAQTTREQTRRTVSAGR